MRGPQNGGAVLRPGGPPERGPCPDPRSVLGGLYLAIWALAVAFITYYTAVTYVALQLAEVLADERHRQQIRWARYILVLHQVVTVLCFSLYALHWWRCRSLRGFLISLVMGAVVNAVMLSAVRDSLSVKVPLV